MGKVMASASVGCSTQPHKVHVTGIPVTALVFRDQISTMLEWAKQRSSRIVCVANVHMLIEARCNNQLRCALDKADLVTPDGMPIVWMMKKLGIVEQDRVAGMDIFLAICQKCMEDEISIYLLGSTQKVLDMVTAKLSRDFPSLKVAGIESPPFRPLSDVENAKIVSRINSSGAGITFISLGCPKQECWMESYGTLIESVMIGVGGVFPVYAGLKKYAPRWLRYMGLEWLYRLIQEPRRLFMRYFKTIPPFIWLALQQIRQQSKQKNDNQLNL